jgi:histone H3/H4
MVSRVEFKVDSLLSFLHRLESPREKEAVRFIESNGGIENCIHHDGLLEELLTKTGEHIEDMSEEETKKLKTQLAKELTENVEELLKKNMANFEGMLRVQNNNIQHMSHVMENSTSQIMKISNEIIMMFPGMKKHVLLTDPVSVFTIISSISHRR